MYYTIRSHILFLLYHIVIRRKDIKAGYELMVSMLPNGPQVNLVDSRDIAARKKQYGDQNRNVFFIIKPQLSIY